MHQAPHIFSKDVRYLYREIALVLLSAIIFAWKNPWWVEFLYMASAALLIGRVIHAETIPGDRQFWITRPYRWQSLVAAKLLFILAFVNVPIFLDQLFIVVRDGFPMGSIWAGLFWSQVLWIFCFSLPAAALAAVTSGLGPFVFASLAAVLAALSVPQLVLPEFRLLPIGPRPIMVEWVHNSAGIAAVVVIALVVLRAQYTHRRTLFSRVFGLAATVGGAAAFLLVPWTFGFGVQMRMPHVAAAAAPISVSIAPSAGRFVQQSRNNFFPVRFRMAIGGAPDSLEARPDAMQLTFTRPNGQTWIAEGWNAQVRSVPNGVSKVEATTMMPASFYEEARHETLNARGFLYFTLFESAPSKSVALADKPVNVGEGLQCYRGAFKELYCRSAFRWPGRLVYAKSGSDLSSFYNLISYSPFPAVLDLDPVESHWAGGASSDRETTLLMKKPLATFRRDLQVDGIRLDRE